MSINDSMDMSGRDHFTNGDRRELMKQSLQLENITSTLHKMVVSQESFEERVRALENFRWFLLGMSSIISVFVVIIMKLLKI